MVEWKVASLGLWAIQGLLGGLLVTVALVLGLRKKGLYVMGGLVGLHIAVIIGSLITGAWNDVAPYALWVTSILSMAVVVTLYLRVSRHG